KLYGTNPYKPDTDGDGYLDGEELIGGYSPLSISKTLVQDNLFKVYSNNVYTLNYPAGWEVQENKDNLGVSFISPAGEIITLATEENKEQLTILAWYLKLVPGIKAEKIEKVSLNKFSGVRSLDGLNLYLGLTEAIGGIPQKMYIFSESIGTKTLADYKTTLLAVVKSFKLNK
ncbi:MAG: thrombospondin type 3 repeat-containing protein, partial [Candidatus Buchananbacteria bacterium]